MPHFQDVSSRFLHAGQAFAKHYNPLLSQETSIESSQADDRQPAVATRCLGDCIPDLAAAEQQLSTAATTDAAVLTDTAATKSAPANADPTAAASSAALELQTTEQDAQADAPKERLARPTHDGCPLAGALSEGRGASAGGKPAAEAKFGIQIAAAMKRRDWQSKQADCAKPDIQSDAHVPQPAAAAAVTSTGQPPQGAQKVSANSAAQSNGAQVLNSLPTYSPAINTRPIRPMHQQGQTAGGGSQQQGSAMQASAPSAASVAMLQNMTAQAASYQEGTRAPASLHSPAPSIDQFSSISSWGAFTNPSSDAKSKAVDSILTVTSTCADTHGHTASAAPWQSAKAQPVQNGMGQGTSQNAEGRSRKTTPASAVHTQKPSAGSIRAMHDSSSSWSNEGNIKKSSALLDAVTTPKQAVLREAQPASGHNVQYNSSRHLASTVLQENVAPIPVCIRSTVSQQATLGQSGGRPGMQPSTVPPTTSSSQAEQADSGSQPKGTLLQPSKAKGDARSRKAEETGLTLKVKPGATPQSGRAKAPPGNSPAEQSRLGTVAEPSRASDSQESCKPGQSVEEMTAWLDAQLSAARGERNASKVPNCILRYAS